MVFLDNTFPPMYFWQGQGYFVNFFQSASASSIFHSYRCRSSSSKLESMVCAFLFLKLCFSVVACAQTKVWVFNLNGLTMMTTDGGVN